MRLAPVASCLALVCLASGPLSAQTERDGFWVSLAAGHGTAGLDCDDCAGSRESGTGFVFRFGGSSSPRSLLGAQLGLWTRGTEGSKVDIRSLLGILQAYPMADAGLFFDFGIGAARAHLQFPAIEYIRTGWAVQFGGGYEIPINRHLAVTPSAFFLKVLGGGNTTFNGADIDEIINPDFFQFNLGLAWH